MATRSATNLATTVAVVAAFAVGVAVDRLVFRPAALGTTGGATANDASRDRSPASPTSDAAVLAARPATETPAAVTELDASSTTSVGAARTGEPTPEETATVVRYAAAELRGALGMVGFGRVEQPETGDRAAATLEALASREDRAIGLLLARWLAARGRTEEAAQRILAQIGRHTPTTEEISYLSSFDARAGLAAARTLVERRPGSPEALVSLAESLEAAGETAKAFDAYAAALRAGLEGGGGTAELARLDPERAIPVLAELYAGRNIGMGARALIEAYLRVGRVAEAGRELTRIVLAEDGRRGLLEAAVVLVPEETARLLAPQMEDVKAAARIDRRLTIAYGAALRRAGRPTEAIPVLRTVFEASPGDTDGVVLSELLRCDPVASRAYVAAHAPPIESYSLLERICVLGLLGRRDEAIAAFEDRLSVGQPRYTYVPSPDEWVALTYAAPDRAIAALRRGLDEARAAKATDVGEWGVSLARALTIAGRVAEARAVWSEIPNRELDLETLVEKAAFR